MKIIKFEIGGIPIEVKCKGIHISDWPFPFYMPFLTQKAPEIKIAIYHSGSLLSTPTSARLFEGSCEGYREWEMYAHEKGFQLEFVHPATQKRDKVAIISRDFSEIDFFLLQQAYTMNEIMRPLMDLILVNYLSLHEGVFIHGASVRDGDRGYAFSGKSGNGKTTMAGIWSQREGDIEVLSDERTIIRKTSEGWKVYGTPWPGDGYIAGASSALLSRIFMISHGRQNEVVSASPMILFQEFFSQVFSNFWDAETLSRITSICEQIVKDGLVSLMPYVPNQQVIEFIRLRSEPRQSRERDAWDGSRRSSQSEGGSNCFGEISSEILRSHG